MTTPAARLIAALPASAELALCLVALAIVELLR